MEPIQVATIRMSAFTQVNIQDLLLQLSDLAAVSFVECTF